MAAPKNLSAGQIINQLRKAEVALANGKRVKQVCRGYCQLVAAGGAVGRWEIEIAQAAVAALHSLKERSRNSR